MTFQKMTLEDLSAMFDKDWLLDCREVLNRTKVPIEGRKICLMVVPDMPGVQTKIIGRLLGFDVEVQMPKERPTSRRLNQHD